MRGVFLNNDVDLHTLCVEKDYNCDLRPFSTMIRLTRLSKPKKIFFPQCGRNPADSPKLTAIFSFDSSFFYCA
jgi:hypothetical protein